MEVITMTIEEAINQLQFDQDMILFSPNSGEKLTLEQVKYRNEDNYRAYIADELAIKALVKQIPKKPCTEISKKSDEGYYCCPNCKNHIEVIGFSAFREKNGMNKFCSYCGQALDWSEV